MAKIPLNPASRADNNFNQPVTAFPDNAIIVTPSDDDHYDTPITVMSAEAGNVAVVPAAAGINGASIVVAVAAGGFIPFRVCKVLATGTTVGAGKLTGAY